MTYSDNVQDTEQAVDTVARKNLLDHTFFAILKHRKRSEHTSQLVWDKHKLHFQIHWVFY